MFVITLNSKAHIIVFHRCCQQLFESTSKSMFHNWRSLTHSTALRKTKSLTSVDVEHGRKPFGSGQYKHPFVISYANSYSYFVKRVGKGCVNVTFIPSWRWFRSIFDCSGSLPRAHLMFHFLGVCPAIEQCFSSVTNRLAHIL